MATKKVVVYYVLRPGGVVNRAYPEFDTGLSDDANVLNWKSANPSRIYVGHEDHDTYTWAFAAAGMVGADEPTQRQWLRDRVNWLDHERAKAKAAQAAKMLPANGDAYGGAAPGTIIRDQHGRSGKVPEVPLETFRNKPISPDAAMEAVRQASKGTR